MRYSRDSYILETNLTPEALGAALRRHTYPQEKLISAGGKAYDFAGIIRENSFRVVGTAFMVGAMCLMVGVCHDGEVRIRTLLHPAFRRLFYLYMAAVFIAALLICMTDRSWGTLGAAMVLCKIAFAAFRLLLHTYYVVGRNIAMRDLRNLLHVPVQ